MNLGIQAINRSKYLFAAATGALIVSSCVSDMHVKEKANALPYLTANELLVAENAAEKFDRDYTGSMEKPIAYWDSILAEYKIQNAYYDGKQYAVDSYKGLNPKKKEYPLNLTEIPIGENGLLKSLNELKETVAGYTTAVEFNKLRENEPSVFSFSEKPPLVKFWRDIRTTFRQRESFEKGVKDANDSIKAAQLPKLTEISYSK